YAGPRDGVAMTDAGDISLPEQQDTVSETVAALRAAGYEHDYGAAEGRICDERSGHRFRPRDFVTEGVSRFEGPTDPGDEAIVLALRHRGSGARGVLVAAYGQTASP